METEPLLRLLLSFLSAWRQAESSQRRVCGPDFAQLNVIIARVL
jgi:hypothetical protein